MDNVETPNWLKGLPMAPVFRPTDTEFADPIAYISKIEKEASAFGICKIIPPMPKPSKKYVFNNLSKSLVKCPELGAAGNPPNLGGVRAVFTTRQQELGSSVKKTKGTMSNQQVCIHKQVWQSGKVYTLEQFEAKSKAFARSLLGAAVKEISPLVIETMFWKATSEKPIYVEYANDVPGSGFGEPEGQFRYFRRQRRTRTRTYYSRQGDKDGVDDNKDSDSCENKDVSPKKDIGASLVISDPIHTSSLGVLSDETPHIYRKSGSSGNNELEGTAGWKLANSPWNLQVIARSAGSLTRFMPDDIPGVTSPMVYIGMLFSWFAWHVEDHELHSMNFLHTGAPKTWYSVPGDYAFAFEEVICTDAFGGNIDRLAALSLLGEKTTILSPEIMVASGIPCCRLVQNPGEFVVTFPRAYHIGFSHGFNCGEAANFATPQWLRYAREAAVRRAAMNYLPMLSHQQLLYLLTMSFMSRVPRSLLPGARSSRSRDRQREEKELLVKMAFLDDMLNENHLLYSLLRKNSGYHAIVWNPSLLTSISKESGLVEGPKSVSTSAKETTVSDCPDQDKSSDNLLKELSSYMEAQGDLDIENDDLFFDFQVDSGTLACVACGVLGFPFMCVMQPSASAAELMPVDYSPLPTHEGLPNAVDGIPSPKDLQVAPNTNFKEGWVTSNRFLRPRVFCLEHGIQVHELLQNKGGANLLVICHSDYQKIKAYAATIAEETRSSFDYKEIPLEGACQHDLNLIEVAIVDEEHGGRSEDWTSRLGINLRHCVKVRKSSPAKQFKHALTLNGLFSGHSGGGSIVLKAKWKARRCRSKTRVLDHPQSHKPCKSLGATEVQQQKSVESVKKVQKIIQYARRKLKSGGVAVSTGHCGNEEHEIQVLEVLGDVTSGFLPAQVAVSPDLTSQFVGSVEVQIITQTSCDMEVDGEFSSLAMQNEDGIATRTEEIGIVYALESSLDSQMQQEIEDNNVSPAELSEGEDDVNDKLPNLDSGGNPSLIDSHGEVKEAEVSDSAEECCKALERSCCVRDCSRTSVTLDGELQVLDQTISSVRSDQKPLLLDSASTSNGELQTEIHEARNEVSCSSSPPGSDRTDLEVVHNKQGKKRRRRKSELEVIAEGGLLLSSGYVKSPCEGLRPRRSKVRRTPEGEEEKPAKKTRKEQPFSSYSSSSLILDNGGVGVSKTLNGPHKCNLEGCRLTFKTKEEVSLHRRNRCHHEGCGKKFSSHKYAVLHQRVHDDDRPFKCPWKGCSMTFKWVWARTEHIRVHTGERPYKCKVDGCGLSFRYISDYSRHRRKTGHYINN